MQAIDWQTVLRRVPCHLLSLRKGASLSHLTAVEARLHESLPTAYREFLLCSDGGWVGDIRLYGTDELAQLLHPRAPGTRPWRCRTDDNSNTSRKYISSLQGKL